MQERLNIEMVRQMNGSDARIFTPSALGSDGERVYINSRFRFYRSTADGAMDAMPTILNTWTSGLIAERDTLWVHGSGGLACSTDGGLHFEEVPLPNWPNSIHAMACADDGTLWAGEKRGVLFFKAPGAKKFTAVTGKAPPVTAIAKGSGGVLVGTEDGKLWIGVAGKLSATSLAAGAPISAVLESERGAIVALSEGEECVSVHRSADGGRSFSTIDLGEDEWLLTLGQVPGGPIVGGGVDGVITASWDDGSSFQVVRHKLGQSERSFDRCCVHQGTLWFGGDFQNLVRVSLDGATKLKVAAKSKASAQSKSKAAAKPKVAAKAAKKKAKR